MEEKFQNCFPNMPQIYHELPKLKTDPIIKWLETKIFTERYLFYNKPKHEAICSNCGPVNMPDDVKHDGWGVCPKCHARVQYKSAGIGRGKLEGLARVLIFQRRGKCVYATTNFIYANYDEGKVKFYKDVDAVFKINRKEQLGYETHYSYFYGGWWKQQKNIKVPYRTGKWRDIETFLYEENLEKVFKNTDLKYCQLAEQADSWSSEGFLELVVLNAKYESVEKIHKVGLDSIIESKLCNQNGSAAVKWKKNNLKDILGLTKDEIYYARQGEITMSTLEKYKKANKAGINISFSEAEKLDIDTANVFYKMRGLIKPNQLRKYLEKQSKSKLVINLNAIAKDYSDYINECKKLKFDLKDKAILFPKNFTEAHARTSAQIHILSNEKESQEVKKRAENMKMLNYADRDFIIRVAESAEEIIIEGKMIGHCVGGYVRDVAAGRTNIFFVRKANDPDKPYFTLELRLREKAYYVAQCRGGGIGKKNGAMTDEVKAFVDKWMIEVVNAKPKRKKKVA